MIEANILSVAKQGRHRYFKFANEHVAHVIESMASLIPNNKEYKKIKGPKLNKLTYARSCYDHLAGSIGVKITNALLDNKLIEISSNEYEVTKVGEKWFCDIDINIDELQSKKRSFAHPCLDWTERKHHIAGALGAAMLATMITKYWLRKKANSRELLITPKGKVELKKRLHLEL